MNELNTNTEWALAATQLQQAGEDYVLVTVLGSRGSTPRDTGTKMVVCAAQSYGTIGGGHLELRAVEIALQMIQLEEDHQRVEYFPLGPSLGQCCGGSTSVLFESFKASRLNVMLFGAGHVGSTLVPILQQLPCRLNWVDSRESFEQQSVPANVTTVLSEAPAMEVAQMPPGSWYLIMTHNHQLDYEILRAVLDRGDAAYVGMIGSGTKWRRFQMRLQHQGYSPDVCDTVHCPIGLDTVPGKRPIEVAVSVAAEIIGLYNQSTTQRSTQRGPARLDLQQLVANLTAGESV